MGTSWGGTDCRSPKPSVSPVAPASLSRAGQEVSMAAPGARAEKAVRWDRGCLHGGRRKGCHCEMEPAGVFQLWRLCLQGRGNGSAGPSVLCTGALLSCLRWLYKVQDQRIPETRSAPARRLPVEGPLGAPRTGPRGFSGCPQVTTIVHREMDSETPSFGILALPEKGLNVPYPRCHKERTTCLSSCPQVTTIILRKMDSNSPSFRTLALPEEVLNVPRPRCPKDRTPWLLWLPPGHHDRPSPGDVIGDAQLQNPRPSRRGVDVPRPRCPKDRTPWLLRPGEQLLPGKNFVASVGAQGLPCSTASVPAMNRFMSLTETS
nr:uncharacterized protein LOC103349155 isoform X4 [Oryctolagus cuniculus]